MDEMNKKWYCSGGSLIRQVAGWNLSPEEAAFWYIGQCGMIIKYGETVCVVDPVLAPVKDDQGQSRKNFEAPFPPEAELPADYVLCTHDHLDHLNMDTLTGMYQARKDTVFIVPAPYREKLAAAGIPEKSVLGARQDEEIVLKGGIRLLPLAVPHDSYAWDEEGNSLALGYVFYCGEIVLFHGGDLVAADPVIDSLRLLEKPISVAFLPINGRDWLREAQGLVGNMNPQEAAHFAECIGADLTIPTHFDMMKGNGEDPLVFAGYMERLYPERRYHILKLGESYIYRQS
ncbi:MBL fold metallo-hydrolase [Cuneatibacter caecimuris]|uniref:L-ascorbate metabolism protein UlaG (Beta-lactamase superfamily) n=1 Tax=Cuneatibacter caecimuris TaxID=1796618 RepID=A0A4Q7PMD0_9FIRM|nr:MBL fold metallo-hydrolase [Cuneatibacter caecimuris]RZT01050.1 L-ascorbate metabolism protein UlaG (beta-lactamase superfamily) [Cuneatibacter caecimuris]